MEWNETCNEWNKTGPSGCFVTTCDTSCSDLCNNSLFHCVHGIPFPSTSLNSFLLPTATLPSSTLLTKPVSSSSASWHMIKSMLPKLQSYSFIMYSPSTVYRFMSLVTTDWNSLCSSSNCLECCSTSSYTSLQDIILKLMASPKEPTKPLNSTCIIIAPISKTTGPIYFRSPNSLTTMLPMLQLVFHLSSSGSSLSSAMSSKKVASTGVADASAITITSLSSSWVLTLLMWTTLLQLFASHAAWLPVAAWDTLAALLGAVITMATLWLLALTIPTHQHSPVFWHFFGIFPHHALVMKMFKSLSARPCLLWLSPHCLHHLWACLLFITSWAWLLEGGYCHTPYTFLTISISNPILLILPNAILTTPFVWQLVSIWNQS